MRFVEKARDAGVDVTFQTWNGTLHDFQWFNLPEAKDAIDKIRDFVTNKMGLLLHSFLEITNSLFDIRRLEHI